MYGGYVVYNGSAITVLESLFFRTSVPWTNVDRMWFEQILGELLNN